MAAAKRSRWRWVVEFAVVAAIVLGYYGYQANRLLPADSRLTAPEFSLPALDGKTYELSDYLGKPTLVYFFAPWCKICNASAHNLNDLAEASNAEFSVIAIVVDYPDLSSVEDFVDRHSLSVPVLLGRSETIADYRVFAIPTYYVVDANGKIAARDFGYSTEIGMRLRLWLTGR